MILFTVNFVKSLFYLFDLLCISEKNDFDRIRKGDIVYDVNRISSNRKWLRKIEISLPAERMDHENTENSSQVFLCLYSTSPILQSCMERRRKTRSALSE